MNSTYLLDEVVTVKQKVQSEAAVVAVATAEVEAINATFT